MPECEIKNHRPALNAKVKNWISIINTPADSKPDIVQRQQASKLIPYYRTTRIIKY